MLLKIKAHSVRLECVFLFAYFQRKEKIDYVYVTDRTKF